ncbi:MAG: polar amino acid transport system permease protein, partial [Myxococcales bacterium]|nr:polar amino acid transport system permease protein [Myxococcales bacterium]
MPDRGKSPRPRPRAATAVSALVLAAFVAALAVALSLSTGCPSPTPAGKGLERIRAAGVLRWGGDTQGGEPYVYDDPGKPGHLIGFEVDLAAAIARELGVRSEFVQNDWSNLVPSLERGTFDIVMNGLEVTDARTGRVLFTRPYYVFAERLMVRATDVPAFNAAAGASKDPSSLLASLKGHKVGTLSNSLAFEMLRANSETVIYEG